MDSQNVQQKIPITVPYFLAVCLLTLLWCYGYQTMNAQTSNKSRGELSQQKYMLYEEIDVAQRLLRSTTNTKTSSLNELLLLQKQISNRKQIITNITQHIQLLNKSIGTTNYQIDSLQQKLELLKNEYAEMVRAAYISQSEYNRLLFLFSAKSFNDAYKRLKYMDYYRSYRKNQLNQILGMRDTLQSKLLQLEQEKIEQADLLTSHQDETVVLEGERSTKDSLLVELKTTEKVLKDELMIKEMALAELDMQITAIIAKEAAEERRRDQKRRMDKVDAAKADARKRADVEDERQRLEALALKEQKKLEAAEAAAITDQPMVTATNSLAEGTSKTTLPPIDLENLSLNFANNKGALAWPVEEGIITGKFGKNPHPVLKNIYTTNNGIDIATSRGATITAVFDGKVTNILFNPTFQWAVIVKHGEYFTVYAKLAEVIAKKGDVLRQGDAIGNVHTSQNSETEVHLEVWKGSNKLNPINWINKSK